MSSSKDQKKNENEQVAGSSSKNNLNTDPSSPPEAKDDLFEPTVDMLVNDFDEEQTLEEEEAMAAKDGHDPGEELSDLQRESEMPIEELLKLYGCGPTASTSSSGSTSRKRRRRQDKSPQPPKQSKKQENLAVESEVTEIKPAPVAAIPVVADEEDSPDEDADAATSTTNNVENTSLNDDETNCEEEEEPSELKKLYNADGELKLDATFSDEEDLDYVPDEEEGKKTIMVGSDYQAVIPEGLLKYDDVLPYENEDKLLWDPTKITDHTLEDYLNKFSSSTNGNHTIATATVRHPRDDEQALLLLLQCGNNIDEALRRRRLGAMQPSNTMSIWSEEECRNFENGIKMYGKSFHEIQSSKVKTRSVGELVEYYYLWKKTERADLFANKARLDKKKYTLNPNVTDFMEKYLEEYDGSNRERDRSVSPNVNSLLQTDMKRAHRSSTAAAAAASSADTSGNNNIKQQAVQQNTLQVNATAAAEKKDEDTTIDVIAAVDQK